MQPQVASSSLSGPIQLDLLGGWLGYLRTSWRTWAAGADPGWIGLPTNNERYPTLGELYLHAWTPMHRYADQMLGTPRAEPPDPPPADFQGLDDWAGKCIHRFKEAVRLLPSLADHKPRTYQTRMAGELRATPDEVLMHAATHCAWHLSGASHLLRQAGIAPPARLDLIFYAHQIHGG